MYELFYLGGHFVTTLLFLETSMYLDANLGFKTKMVDNQVIDFR